MIIDHSIVWNNCLDIIKKNVPPQSFRTWFEPIKSIKFSKNVLTIQVPNKFFYEWLEENYVDVLRKAIKSSIGHEGSLEYQILMDKGNTPSRKSKPVDSNLGMFSQNEIQNPFIIPGIKKVKIDSQINKKYTFDTFVEGECNKLARSAGMEIANKPGLTPFNPLVIFGDTGLGKTHLCHAIGNAIMERHKNKQVLYVSVEQFTNQVIKSIKDNAVNDFMNFYQMIDVLIVDDIQFLANRPKTQDVFFNIFNTLHQSGKQIILTSDRPPKELEDVQKRLISRFKWGLNADLGLPTYDTRVDILKNKMIEEGIQLSDETIEYICHHIKNNIRELEGVLISLIARSSLNKKKIDLDLVREVVDQFVIHESREISVENIKRLVAEHFELPLEKLQSSTRKRNVVIARQLSMYLAKNYTTNSLKSIGHEFGGKDHSTVIYSIKAVKDLMDTDLLFKDTVSQLEKKVQLSLHV